MERIYRVAIIAVLLLATGGVCMQYATAEFYTYPSTTAIDDNPERYDGDQIFLFGEVNRIDSDRLQVVGAAGQNPERQFAVWGVDSGVRSRIGDSGNAIQVYGTLQDGSSAIEAERVVIDFRNWKDRIYVYGLSLVGAFLAITYFLSHWRISLRNLGFEPRGEP